MRVAGRPGLQSFNAMPTDPWASLGPPSSPRRPWRALGPMPAAPMHDLQRCMADISSAWWLFPWRLTLVGNTGHSRQLLVALLRREANQNKQPCPGVRECFPPTRPNEFILQAADILLHCDTLASKQIKHVIYAGHAWHQREHGRRTANLATTSDQESP